MIVIQISALFFIGLTFLTMPSSIDSRLLSLHFSCEKNISYRPNPVKHHRSPSIYTATTASVSPAASAFIYASVISRVR